MSTQNNPTQLVTDVMLAVEHCPIVAEDTMLKEALEVMDKCHLGVVCIVDRKKRLKGVLTEGDIRRTLLRVQKPFAALLTDDVGVHKTTMPVSVSPRATLISALEKMGEKKIWDLPVVNDEGILIGLLHLHEVILSVMKRR